MSSKAKDGLKVYGYCVVYKKDGAWKVDQCDEYRNLPAHYNFKEEAEERLRFLRQRNVECRMAALMVEETDTEEEFEAARIRPGYSKPDACQPDDIRPAEDPFA